mmetsp:Transcript_34308/g.89109  ORF Transcript_34308/g.89109 Transcript_34308/m.89109 type:complete len:216 (+) Transcript_34308:144-791(+)
MPLVLSALRPIPRGSLRGCNGRAIVRCSAYPALKEWAVACAALGDGGQTVLLRKGGIKDPVFKAQAGSFLLFPTAFHNAGDLVQPTASAKYAELLHFELGNELELLVAAELTGCWTTQDPMVLQLTSDLHVWNEGLLHTRMKWKPSQPITVMELRCRRRSAPLRCVLLTLHMAATCAPGGGISCSMYDFPDRILLFLGYQCGLNTKAAFPGLTFL